jgi:hypothetical protein
LSKGSGNFELTDFNKIFCRFNQEEGIYGFADLQVRAMHEELRAVPVTELKREEMK